MTSPVEQLIAEVEPEFWQHRFRPIGADRWSDWRDGSWLSKFSLGYAGKINVEWEDRALYTSEALIAERGAREKAEEERDDANRRWSEVCADFIALQKTIVGESGLSAILRAEELKIAEAALKGAVELLKPLAQSGADIDAFYEDQTGGQQPLGGDEAAEMLVLGYFQHVCTLGHLRTAAAFLNAREADNADK